MRYALVVVLLLGLHAALALHTALNQSPGWDEVVYPAAGFDLWRSGRVRTSLDHPPLGKVLLALPLLGFGSKIQLPARTTPPFESFRYGFEFVHQNGISAKEMILLPRLVSLLFSCGLAFWVFWLAKNRWGNLGGCLALSLYAVSPPVLARASLAVLEMPLAFFMMGSFACYAAWQDTDRPGWAWGWVLCWWAAAMTKATAWILLPAFFLADQVGETSAPPPHRWRRWQTLLAAGTVLALCEVSARVVGSSYLGPQVIARKALLGSVSMPIYFHGRLWERPSPLVALAEWVIKTPVSILFLGTAGLIAWLRKTPQDPLLKAGVLAFLVFLGQAAILRTPCVATAHIFWFYPWICLAASGVVLLGQSRAWKTITLMLVLTLAAESAIAHPHHGAYCNFLIGGSSQGYQWVADSDQDWGQELPSLAAWMRRQKKTQVLLAYSGAGDPRVYGIHYQDVISPALVTGVYRGEVFPAWLDGIWLAVGTKVAQSEPDLFGWLLKNRRPAKVAGYTFLLYDLTNDSDALGWLKAIYRVTRRPALAAAIPLPGQPRGSSP
jgi:hypothetical protein